MKAELKRAADLVAFHRREALARKRLSGDPRNPFLPRYGAELTFTAAAQEAETLGYILKLLEKEAARECARRVFPTLDAILSNTLIYEGDHFRMGRYSSRYSLYLDSFRL